MRVLLVEDDPIIGDGIQAGLSDLDYAVDWFSDGKAGLEAGKSADYDAAVAVLPLPSASAPGLLGS